jgi:hypothetical protein
MRVFTVLTLATLAAAATGCTSSVKSSEPQTFTYDCSGLGKAGATAMKKRTLSVAPTTTRSCPRRATRRARTASGNTEMRRTLVVTCKH